jgi:hypothetical protein
MSDAVRLMVETWVNLKDRKSIEELRDHRVRLRNSLREKHGVGFVSTKRVIESDLNEAEAGLARLQ